MSESNLLHPYLLRDVLDDAIKQMEILLQKYKADGFTDMYCKGYKEGVAFSKEKVEQMFEEWTARSWSDGLDERDLENAIAEYEMQS